MSEPNVQSLEDLGARHFSFYPVILNIEHNEWRLGQMNWSEIQVINSKTGLELWIPRRFVGEVSGVDEPVVIVGLRKELEYKAGAVWPHERQFFAIPGTRKYYAPRAASSETRSSADRGQLAPGPEKKVGRLIGGVLLAGVALIVLAVAITQRPISYKGIEQIALQLSGDDDYNSIVRKLGPPSEDHWRVATGELQYRALFYKNGPYSLILMGADRNSVRYIGAMDKDWRPVHSIRLRDEGDTLAMLRQLPKF